MKKQFVTYEIALGLKKLGFAIFFRTILNNGRTAINRQSILDAINQIG